MILTHCMQGKKGLLAHRLCLVREAGEDSLPWVGRVFVGGAYHISFTPRGACLDHPQYCHVQLSSGTRDGIVPPIFVVLPAVTLGALACTVTALLKELIQLGIRRRPLVPWW